METIKVRDLSLWEAFLWTARKGQFTGAATALKTTTAQVSKRVNQLESTLGCRLFQRTTRRVSLTREGQALLPRVEQVLESAQGLEGGPLLNPTPAGRIRVACLPSFAVRCLAPSLPLFQKQYPDLEIEINTAESLIDLVENQIDVALRIQNPKGAQFVFRKILENRIVLVASPGFLEKHPLPIKTPADLQRTPLLTLDLFEGLRFIREEIRIGQLKCPRPIRCESGSMITELCLQGAGVAVRSAWDVGPLIQAKKLVRVLPKSPIESFGTLYAVTPHRNLLPERVRVFIDHVIKSAEKWRRDMEF